MFCLSILIVCVGFIGCKPIPDLNKAEEIYQKNQSDIRIVVDYMVNSKYNSIYIRTKGNTIWADFEDIKVNDSRVVDAINSLIGNDYINIYKDGNTLCFLQWRRFNNMGAGIVYSIDETSLPKLDYCTTILPMQESGWYYYLEDAS